MSNNNRHQLTLTTRQLELLSNACRLYATKAVNGRGDNVDIVRETHQLIHLLDNRAVKGKVLDSWPGM